MPSPSPLLIGTPHTSACCSASRQGSAVWLCCSLASAGTAPLRTRCAGGLARSASAWPFGAHRHAVLSMILSDALKLVALGIGVGVPIAVAGGYSLRAFLFGVTPIDPAALAAASAVLALAALLAAYLPARRAAAVDPLVALRWE